MQLRREFHSGVNKRGDNVRSLRSNEAGVIGATRSCVQRFIHYTSLSGPTKHRRSSDTVVVVARFSVTQRRFPRRTSLTCLDNSRDSLVNINLLQHRLYTDTRSFYRYAHRRRSDSIFSFWSCNSSLSEIECRCRSTRSRLSAIDVGT